MYDINTTNQLPYPIAYLNKRLIESSKDGLLLKRIALNSNMIIRFLSLFSIAEKVSKKITIDEKSISILRRKDKLNSDWVKLFEFNNERFNQKSIYFAHDLLSIRNLEAHSERDIMEIEYSTINDAFNKYWMFINEISTVLSDGEMVLLGDKKTYLTGPESSEFKSLINFNFGGSVQKGLYWFDKAGSSFCLEPFFIFNSNDKFTEFYSLNRTSDKFEYVSLNGEKIELSDISIDALVSNATNSIEISTSISQLTNQNIETFTARTLNYIPRMETEKFIDEFLYLNSNVAFVNGKSGSGVSSILLNIALRYREAIPLLYVQSISQLLEFAVKNNLFTQRYILENGVMLIIDKIDDRKEIAQLISILERIGKVKAIVGITPIVGGELFNYGDIPYFKYIVHDVPPLNDEEVRKIIKVFSTKINIEFPIKLLDIVLHSSNISLRHPNTLEILCLAIKENDTLTGDINILSVYKIFEEEILEKYKLFDLVDHFASLIYRKRVNQLSFKESGNLDVKLKYLISIGLIVENNYGYKFSNEEYLHYRIASKVFADYGIIDDLKMFEFWEESIAYYIAIASEMFDILKFKFDISSINVNQRLKLIDIVSSSNIILKKLMTFEVYFRDGIEYGRYLRNKGLIYSSAKFLNKIQNVPHLSSQSMIELNAELMLTTYYVNGEVIEIDNAEGNPLVQYYRGLTYYFNDNFINSKAHFTKAFENISSDYPIYKQMNFDYIELLIDIGDYSQAESIIIKHDLLLSHDNSDKAKLCNHKGIIEMEKGNFDASYKILKEGLELYKHTNNLNGISKSLGDLSLIDLYKGRLKEAEEKVKDNIFYCEVNKNLNGLAASNHLMGNIKLFQKNLPEAKRYFELSQFYANKSGNSWRKHTSTLYLFIIRNEESIDLQEIERLASTIESQRFKAEFYRLLSLYYVKLDKQRAIESVRKAIDCSKQIGSLLQEGLCITQIAELDQSNEYVTLIALDQYSKYFKEFMNFIGD